MKSMGRNMIRHNLNPRFSRYNQGVLFIAQISTQDTDFGAVTNATKMSDMTKLVRLDYEEMSKRERDVSFAEASDHTLDLKVKTRYHAAAKAHRQVLINNKLYDIFQVDGSSVTGEMYLYLEEVRELADG